MATSFSGRGCWSIQGEPPTMGKQLKLGRVECKGLVVNMKRHMRFCHPDIVEEVIQKARVYDRKECNACGARTTRLDLHLIRVHGMEREELLAVVKGSPVITAETKSMATLDKCLNDFKKQVTSRRNSADRSTGTVESPDWDSFFPV